MREVSAGWWAKVLVEPGDLELGARRATRLLSLLTLMYYCSSPFPAPGAGAHPGHTASPQESSGQGNFWTSLQIWKCSRPLG